MNSAFLDPDLKISMSLDEIIQLTRGQVDNRCQSRCLRTIKKRKMYHKKKFGSNSNHSVPLLGSGSGVDIYVSKRSPLLSAENRRRIAQTVSNRVINTNLIEKSKQIIPAEYKLVKTTTGVERVLVPSTDHISKLTAKRLEPPRKLLRDLNVSNLRLSRDFSFRDKPPPLVTAPIFSPPGKPAGETRVDVDADDDNIILEVPNCKKKHGVIYAESSLPVDVWQAKKYCILGSTAAPSGMKTLNDRFTMLTGSFKF